MAGGQTLEKSPDSTVADGAYPKVDSACRLLGMATDEREDLNAPSGLLPMRGGSPVETARAKGGHRDAVNLGIKTI
jgi:hypothetical protein